MKNHLESENSKIMNNKKKAGKNERKLMLPRKERKKILRNEE